MPSILVLICMQFELIHGFKKSFSLFYVCSFILSLYCILPQIKNQMFYLNSTCLFSPQNNMQDYWNKQRINLVSDQILKDGWEEVGKWLTNAWFVHCLKATEIFHHYSISNFFPLYPSQWMEFIQKCRKVTSQHGIVEQAWVLDANIRFYWSLTVDISLNLSESESHFQNGILNI